MSNRSLTLIIIPGVLVCSALLIIPLLLLFVDTIPEIDSPFSLYQDFLNKTFHQKILFRTIKVALITTIICIILAYPSAFFIALKGKRFKSLFIVIAVFPLLLSPVVRSFAWMVIIGKNGFVNDLLLWLSIIEKPIQILYTEFAVIIGLTYLFLPLMILPLSSSGLLVGSVLVFTESLTAYTTPRLLGGDQAMTLSTLIYQNAMTLFEWDTASVIAIIMILITYLVMKIIGVLANRMNPDS